MGLITYMRTDSLRLSDEAVKDAAPSLKRSTASPTCPRPSGCTNPRPAPRTAMRPSGPPWPSLTPDKVKGSLTSDQYKLYKLIWERFIASQMATALLDTVSADIHAGDYLFKASGYS